MLLDEIFDVNDLPESQSNYDPLPAGWYSATISGVEIKNTKSGTGKYLSIRYDITGPTHQGRVIFGNLNIRNANPKAEEIGRQQMGELMKSIGVARVTDTDQLVGGQLQVKLAIRQSEEYGAQNEVKGFKPLDGAMPVAVMPKATTAVSAAPTTAKAAPPWAKK